MMSLMARAGAAVVLLFLTGLFSPSAEAFQPALRQSAPVAMRGAKFLFCHQSGAFPRAHLRRPRSQCTMQMQMEDDKAGGIRDDKAGGIRVAEKPEPEIVCMEGLCAVSAEDNVELTPAEYWFPRALFLSCCVAYGTNFALGRFMNEALAPSVVSGLRFSLAAVALSPFLKDIKKELIKDSVLMSLFIAAGYIGQSISLQTIEAGKAGFICSLSVIICPILEIVFDNKKVSAGLIAAVLLSVTGVGILELTGDTSPAIGDLYACAQPIGFGVGYYLTEKMMRNNPSMTIPITAVQTAVVGAVALAWMLGEGYVGGHLTDGSMYAPVFSDSKVAGSLLWTGIVTTALTRLGETKALSGISSSEASVLMTTEPIWAALWGSLLMGEVLGQSAYLGGGLIMAACAANIVDPVKAREVVLEVREVMQEATTTIYRQGTAMAQRLGSMRRDIDDE
eukprot:CAMPEP_0173059552 /NCGR_PEP_ID=MMETSP1102-20130122/2055_1 /TAXON_ID=49646 /ORGANISM="Geminigera sp., Strain Caron Lab Isolate" /LENGTH=449 /DNA_ID=CAMNT_0013925583 /DNA_START=94 /DNA_END=1443 /DNA_ORIENTATION=+